MLNSYLIWSVIGLNILDLISTYVAIDSYGGREANPVVKWLMDRLGLIGGLVVVKAVGLSPLFLISFPDWALGILVGWYLFVVINNAGYIFKR